MMIDVGGMPPDRAVDRLISHAVSIGASDLFLLSNDQHMAAMVRHLGIVRPIAIEQPEAARRIIGHIRANSAIDLTERRRPLDGRWIWKSPDGNFVDLRINVIPTMYGEDIAMRLLARGRAIFNVDNLGMSREQQQSYEAMLANPSGLILITGPTGSGKTGTLYSSLIKLNDGRKKINTIEDPIEYAVDGLRQSQVNPAIDLTFAHLLRAVLRQSPDVIMIGEIRDPETARTAVHAANSGILVLATLHAPSAAGAIQSMKAYDVPPHFLSTSLLGVISQRLVRTLDPATRQGFDLTDAPHTFDEIKKYLKGDEGKTLFTPGPAESNQMTGYSGRTGVFEILKATREVRAMIAEGATTRQIRDKAVEQGMLEFRKSALIKVAQGHTTTEEVFRVVPGEEIFIDD